MGFLTLGDFRDEVANNMAGETAGNERVDRWINMALLELCNAVEFKALFSLEDLSTLADTVSYPIIGDTIAVRTVTFKTLGQSNTLSRQLLALSYEAFHGRDFTSKGVPSHWTRYGGELHLWPVPNKVYELQFLRVREPLRLSLEAETTELPSVWDEAVILLGTSFGLQSIGEIEIASAWLNRARLFIGSRETDSVKDLKAPGEGVDVVHRDSSLTRLTR